MAHNVNLPGRPSLMKEGAYRVNEVPLMLLSWTEKDGRGVERKRNEALMDVVSTIDPKGTEDTAPRAMWMRSRTFEEFVKLVEMIGEFSDRGYDPQSFLVHIAESGEVKIHRG